MKKYYPYIYFWITALVIIIIGEFSIINSRDAIDINYKDTYYIVAVRDLTYVFSSLYLLAGFIYWLFQKFSIQLQKNLIVIHTIVSISTVIVYYAFFMYYRYFRVESIFNPSKETYINLILVFTTVTVQIHFIYNIIYSVIKHAANKKI